MTHADLLLNELFKTSTEGYNKKYSNNVYSVEFTVKDLHYLFNAKQVYAGEWDIGFYLVDSDMSGNQINYQSNLTRTGHVFQVLSSVMHLLEKFMAEMQPRVLTFSADMHERSRIKLYDRLTALFARQQHLHLETSLEGHFKVYVLSVE